MRTSVAVVVGLVVLVVALALVVHAAGRNSGPQAKSDRYQAVFLTNGQVYFGHLHHASDQHPTLTDVYYLQTAQTNLQSGSSANGHVSLVKLGNELHGPEDEMVLNDDAIQFWENLKDDGKVVEAIRRYQGQG